VKEDSIFIPDLNQGHASVEQYAALLRESGLDVQVPELVVRPDSSVRHEYADEGDLFLERVRVEVKRRSFSFQDRDSFPYPTVIIDETYKANNPKDSPLLCYVILSQDMKCAAVIFNATRDKWIAKWKFDRSQGPKGRYCLNYEIDKRWARFCDPARFLG
jgi:hypothetical protein